MSRAKLRLTLIAAPKSLLARFPAIPRPHRQSGLRRGGNAAKRLDACMLLTGKDTWVAGYDYLRAALPENPPYAPDPLARWQ